MDSVESLRACAGSWSLGGDRQLLAALQDIHQRVCAECVAAARRLRALGRDVRRANARLNNVNNRFVSLSNGQFVESRVLDDTDTADTADTTDRTDTDKEPSVPVDPLARLRSGVSVLCRAHEAVSIWRDSDSDSDTDSDADHDADTHRRVLLLRARDVYAARPLPRVIGSAHWRTLRHAGLLCAEAEDSASSCSPPPATTERGHATGAGTHDEYSDSDHDHTRHTQGSVSSSERSVSPVPGPRLSPGPVPGAPSAPSPAALAAELALKLGGTHHHAQPPAPVPAPDPVAAPRAWGRTQPGQQGLVFPEEPPPLPVEEDEESSSPDEHEDDVFAELRRAQHDKHAERSERGLGAALRAETTAAGTQYNTTQVSPAGDTQPRVARHAVAATRHDDTATHAKTEKDIFDALFAKHDEILQRKDKAGTGRDDVTTRKDRTVPEKKVDIFSDDLFDDIDDIFTSAKVAGPVAATGDRVAGLFDDDDLFADVAVPSTSDVTRGDNKTTDKTRGIFDSDDELFSDAPANGTTTVKDISKGSKGNEISKVTKSIAKSSLFDDDDDTDLFSDKPAPAAGNIDISGTIKSKETNRTSEVSKRVGLFDDDGDELFSNKAEGQRSQATHKIKHNDDTNVNKITKDSDSGKVSKTIFDDDDILGDKPQQALKKLDDKATSDNKVEISKETDRLFDDSDDDIFSNIKVTKPVRKLTETTTSVETTKNIDQKLTETKPIVEINRTIGVSSVTRDRHRRPIGDETHQLQDDVDSVLNNNIKRDTIDKTNENNDIFFKSEVKSKPNTIGLFDDDDDLFGKVTKPTKQLPNTDKNDDIIFGNEIGNKETINTAPVVEEQEIIKHNKRLGSNNDLVEENTAIDKESDSDMCEAMSTRGRTAPDRYVKPLTLEQNTASTIIEREVLLNKSDSVTNKSDEKPNVTTKPDLEYKNMQHKTETVNIENVKNVEITIDNEALQEKPYILHTDTLNTDIKHDLDNMRDVDANKNITGTGGVVSPAAVIASVVVCAEAEAPPAFTRLGEHKRSRNVNALFDDDSDDEALFYRRSDVTLHDTRLRDNDTKTDTFGLFQDEPPDIDAEYTEAFDTNEPANDYNTRNAHSEGLETSDELFDDNSRNDDSESIKTNDTVTKAADTTDNTFNSKRDDDMEREPLPEPPALDGGRQDNATDTRKIGKLKPMGFSINVNTLLPGASPRKTPRTPEQANTKSDAVSAVDHPELMKAVRFPDDDHSSPDHSDYRSSEHALSPVEDPELVQGVRFPDAAETPALDHSASKHRARIPVRRRPSTRRARRHAAETSGIDFGGDTTDGAVEKAHTIGGDTAVEPNQHQDGEGNDNEKASVDSEVTIDGKVSNAERKSSDIRDTNIAVVTDYSAFKDMSSTKASPSRDVKAKIVYILNDEDIFSNTNSIDTTKPEEYVNPQKNIATKKSNMLNIVDDDDDIFKSMTNTMERNLEADDKPDGVRTLGQAYAAKEKTFDSDDDDIFKDFANVDTKSYRTDQIKPKLETVQSKPIPVDTKLDKPKKSLFDDSSDEESELFNTKKPVAKASVFNSDSDEELFGSRSRTGRSTGQSERQDALRVSARERQESRRELARVSVREPLFGAEDEEELFGAAAAAGVCGDPLSRHTHG